MFPPPCPCRVLFPVPPAKLATRILPLNVTHLDRPCPVCYRCLLHQTLLTLSLTTLAVAPPRGPARSPPRSPRTMLSVQPPVIPQRTHIPMHVDEQPLSPKTIELREVGSRLTRAVCTLC